MRELRVVDAARRVVHRHDGLTPDGSLRIDEQGADGRLVPRHAPEDFAFSLDAPDAIQRFDREGRKP